MGGAELPDLPASILTVMNAQRISPGSNMGDHSIFEESVPIDLELFGSKTIRLQVDK
jgi:hypothetical protein